MKKLRNREGFTLIEVVVVMAIIAVLAVLVVGAIIIARNTAKETANRSNAKAVQTAFESKYAASRSYPGNINGNCNVSATLTALGLSSTSLSGSACSDTGGCVISNTGTGATSSTYTINVNTKDCGTNYNSNDQLNNP
ncbi:prepilin-type N-terminal cleavage/methylation domain-containing protein [candidate division WS5 bacterium]|uniref:Prepilin-type N-terminal cleavage/methylation domain-containing protein n=1 Tax=candidate division WS5 bacterium TaxID=2093353 RepID=A0A419DFV3_9BACT|nr:MAG: prepilin-type N-terminal cleavage/methylation domain-containing protein [candidate division WS5 bacterium]